MDGAAAEYGLGGQHAHTLLAAWLAHWRRREWPSNAWAQEEYCLPACLLVSPDQSRPEPSASLQGALPGEHGGALPPTARGPACADPTVTISTRAAFEAINAMFGGGGSGGLAAAPSQPAPQQHAGSDADGFRVPAPRPPRARPAAPAPAASPGGFCIHEDTQFVSVAVGPEADSPAGGGGGGFCIHEDTQFITVPAGGPDGDAADEAAPMAAAAGGHAAAVPSPGGFCIREDTQFITVAVQPDEEEDEEQQMGDEAAGAPPAAAPAAAPAPLFGGFSIREDTQFIGLGGGASPTPSPSPEPAAALGGGGGSGRLLPQKRPLGALDGSTGDLLGAGAGSCSPLDDASPMLSGGAVQVGC